VRSWRSVARGSGRHGGGFTLIELLVVIAILSLSLVLVVGYKPPWRRALSLEGAAAEIAEGLRSARSEAILHNRPVSFAINLAAHRYQVGGGPVRDLPPHLAIMLLTVAGEKRDAQTGGIRFDPDGTSTGGRISLADGSRAIAVGIDWLTGRVSVADVR
jgi:general secretion pathway protein H